jgi:polar amino acid transport system permease protein
MDFAYFFKILTTLTPALLTGLAITVGVSVVAQTVGVVLGVFSALGGMARNPVLRGISGVYVWFFRGTPVLVQMFLIYFGTPHLLGIDLFPREMTLGFIDLKGAIIAGTVALAINEGAYMSEIVRAGILSVDPGQTEAAKSLGMPYGLTMRRVVLPQALRVIIPPLGNEFNNMLKTTSLMSVIAVEELFRYYTSAASGSFKPFEAYLAAALWYLLLTTIWSFVQGFIERRAGAGTRRNEDPGFWSRMLGGTRSRDGGQGTGTDATALVGH